MKIGKRMSKIPLRIAKLLFIPINTGSISAELSVLMTITGAVDPFEPPFARARSDRSKASPDSRVVDSSYSEIS